MLIREPEETQEELLPTVDRSAVNANTPPIGADEERGSPEIPEKHVKDGYGKPILIAAGFVAACMIFFAASHWKALKHKPGVARAKAAARLNYFDCDSGCGISKIAWSTRIKSDYSTPVLLGDMLYFAKDRVIYTMNPETGEIKKFMETWVNDVGGLAIEDGKLCISGNYAISVVDLKTKEELWEFPKISGVLAVYSDVIYLRLVSDEVVAVDFKTGEKISQLNLGTEKDAGATFSVSGGTVFSARDMSHDSDEHDYILQAFDPGNGKVKWEWEYKSDYAYIGGPYAANGMVFMKCFFILYALDINSGKVLWSKNIMPRTTPAVTEGTVFVGGDSGFVYAIDLKTGVEKWRFGGPGMSFKTVSATNKYLYASSTGGMIYVLDADTGYEETRFYLKTTLRAPPTITEKALFADGNDGVFYSLPLE